MPPSRTLLALIFLLHGSPACAQALPASSSPGADAAEIALAESAAPPHVGGAAAVYVAAPDGYRLARAGSNGYSCLVERSAPESVEPICYDAEGSRTLLPVTLETAALRARGLDSAAVARRIADGYQSGRFRAPQRTGVAWMVSPHTRFTDPATGKPVAVGPHVMFYAPYLTNRDIASRGEEADHTFVINEGAPNAYIIVMLPPHAEDSRR